MSRKKKEFSFNDKKIIFEELRVKDILDLLNLEGGFFLNDFKKLFYDFLPRFTNLTLPDIIPLTPSELSELYKVFKEVNSDFFNAFKSLGIGDYLNGMLQELKKTALQDLSAMYADSSKKDTQKSGNTDSVSS